MGTDDAIGVAVVLRAAVAVLLLANVAFFGWTQGWLGDSAPALADREPGRLERQVQPDVVRIVPLAGVAATTRARATPAAAATPLQSPPAAAGSGGGGGSGSGSGDAASAPRAAAAPAAGNAPACLQAGPFTPVEVTKVEAALGAALPAARGSWANVKIETPGIWLVYMGRYADRDTLRARMDELRRFPGLSFEELQGAPSLEPGIVLGRHDTKAAADAVLARLVERGVKTAKVVALSPPAAVHLLRVERADAALRQQLTGLSPGTLAGSAFRPCPGTAAASGDAAASGAS